MIYCVSVTVAELTFIPVFVIVHGTYRPRGGGDDTVRAPDMDHHLCSCGRNFTAGNNHSYPLEGESSSSKNRALSLFLSVNVVQTEPAVASGRGDSFGSSDSAMTIHVEAV